MLLASVLGLVLAQQFPNERGNFKELVTFPGKPIQGKMFNPKHGTGFSLVLPFNPKGWKVEGRVIDPGPVDFLVIEGLYLKGKPVEPPAVWAKNGRIFVDHRDSAVKYDPKMGAVWAWIPDLSSVKFDTAFVVVTFYSGLNVYYVVKLQP